MKITNNPPITTASINPTTLVWAVKARETNNSPNKSMIVSIALIEFTTIKMRISKIIWSGVLTMNYSLVFQDILDLSTIIYSLDNSNIYILVLFNSNTMKMHPREIIKTCSTHYQTWKNEAFKAETPEERKKFLEKAFFWLELQSNLLILWTVENTMNSDPNIKEKVKKAHINVNKKIAEYASEVLKDLR